ncbi:MAG TPA: PA2169 family four-helix-bundle protein [Polaromonas sp.]|uniref:ferritin-like domain-containing protein n=1 Tax=Polaromonas sp. TaxID=1869339 RepID=UPI002D71E00E|nr:PA2169 family four-helix-bundle protein [Polaromonas sp.]HYW57861.1 PA2169 family four-helix-bundle protein [Polaromonas sp.]
MSLDRKDKDLNLDPITDEPGAHPVGTGLGAVAGGAAAGAAAGVIAGPVGAVAGAIVGAVAGGLGGKAIAESVNPTAEEAYWRESYNKESYYEQGRTYDDYGPAYRLGVQGRTSYDGSFDDAQPHLETQWNSNKDRSTLSWPQAQVASRAAWNRIDDQFGSGRVSGGDIDNVDVIDTLNDLVESCRDGEYGFRECAEHIKAQDIKTLLLRHAEECRTAAAELATQVRQLGGDIDEGGTTAGALHRGWVSVRGTLSGYTDLAMLNECERGEDAALARYRKALKENLPANIRAIVERQAQGTQRNHDQVKAMRDALKSTS